MKKLLLVCFLLTTNFILSHAQVTVDTIGAGNDLVFTDAASSYVNLGNFYNTTAPINFPFSFEAWVYPTVIPSLNGDIYSSDNETNAYCGFNIQQDWDGYLDVQFADDQGGSSGNRRGFETVNQLPINQWTHIGIVCTSVTNVYVYFNGVLQSIQNDGGGSNITTITHGSGDASIGEYYGIGYQDAFIGLIDEVRLWNIALSQSEIQYDMCKKINPDTTGLIGYWKADEASTNDTVYDYTSNHVNGKIVGTVGRKISDAPLGNTSNYLYTSSWSNNSVKLGSETGDTLITSQISGTPDGVQIYAINSQPYYTEGLRTVNSNYFGVFCISGSSTPSYTVTCHYSVNDGILNSANQDSAILQKRIDATDTPWTPLNGTLNTIDQTVTKISQPSPQEYIVDIHCNLTLSATPQTPLVCRGRSITLSVSGGNSYTWSPSSGLSATTGEAVVASPTTNATYTLIGTSSRCSDTLTIAVRVVQDSLKVSTNSPSVCQGNSVILTATGAYSYSWLPSTGLNQTTGDNITATPFSTTTYTIVATGTAGCLDTQKVTVTINPPPVLSITPSSPQICIGQSTPLTVKGAATYFWSPSTSLTATTGSSTTATPTVTTTYTAYGSSTLGCNDSAKVIVKVNPLPVLVITPPDSAICRGYSAALLASGALTYKWSPSSGLSSTTNSTAIAEPTITTTYKIIGTSSSGCIDSTTAPIRVVQDSLKVSTNSTSVCQGNSVVLTASGDYGYSWSPSTGLNITTGDTVTATPFSTTTYTLIGMGPIGCQDTQKVAVTVNLPPNLTITPTAPQICIGQSASLIVKGAATYHWSPSTGLTATSGSSTTATPTVTTTYTAYGTSFLGCNDSAKVTVKVNPLPVLIITPSDTALCRGYPASLTASGASTYKWSPSSGLSSVTNSTVIAQPTITTTYKLTGTSSSGCIDSTIIPIRVVQDSLKASITDTSVCQGNSAVLTASADYGYTWSPSTGLNQTTGSSVTATPTLTTSYTLIGTGPIGCLDTQKVVVNIYLPPVLAITPPSPQICIGHPVELNVSGASIYHWSPSSGLSLTTGSSVSANPVVLTTYTAYGTDVHGCNDSAKVSIIVNLLPIVTIAPLDSIVCNGLSVPLTVRGTSSYQWSPAAGLSSTTDSNVVAAPLATTTYTVYGTDSLGCVDTVSAIVKIIPNTIVITVIPTNSIICLGNSAFIEATGGTHYSWSPSVGISATTGDTLTANPVSTTTYTVIGTGLGDCADTTVAIIVVSPPPVITVEPASPVMCYGQAMPLTASGAATYEWIPSTGLYETSGSAVDAHSVVTTNYTVYGTDSLFCNDSTKFTLTVKPSPVSSFTTAVPSICDPLQIQFSNTSTDGVSYFWNFGDGDTSTEQNPAHLFPKTGIYTITLISTSENGCMDTLITADTLTNGHSNLFVANSFTPSIQGMNQTFKPDIVCTAPSNYFLKIYDRWGVTVFESDDPTIGWDGTYKGKPQPLGTYVYYLQVNCGICTYSNKGDLTLIR